MQEATPVSPQPPDEPPLEEPPLDDPPLEDPPLDEPPLEAPPLDEAPLDAPPLDDPPLDDPPPEELPLEELLLAEAPEEPLDPPEGRQWPLTKQAVPGPHWYPERQLRMQTPSASQTSEVPPSGLHAAS